MVREIRALLLSKVLSMEGNFDYKYSTAYNTLLSIIELEKNDKESEKLSKDLFKEYEDIKKNVNNLHEKVKGIPLLIIEENYFRFMNEPNKFLYLCFEELESNNELRVIDLYYYLEKYFSKIYILCVKIADYYSLDIKLKTSKDNQDIQEIF